MSVTKKVQAFLDLLNRAEVIRVDQSPLLTHATVGVPIGDADNEVVTLEWESESLGYSVTLTEGGLESGTLNPATGWFELEDAEGNTTQLFLGRVIPVDVVVEGWV